MFQPSSQSFGEIPTTKHNLSTVVIDDMNALVVGVVLLVAAGIYYYHFKWRKRNTPHDLIGKLSQNFDWRAETFEIIKRPCNRLPIAIDLPRLASHITVKTLLGVFALKELGTTNQRVIQLLILLEKQCNGVDRTDDDYRQYIKQGDLLGLSEILEDMKEDNLVAIVLKTLNQSAIARAVTKAQLLLKGAMFDTPGGWEIEVDCGKDNEPLMITHKRVQRASFGSMQFQFALLLSFVIDRSGECKQINLTMSDYSFPSNAPQDVQESCKKLLSKV